MKTFLRGNVSAVEAVALATLALVTVFVSPLIALITLVWVIVRLATLLPLGQLGILTRLVVVTLSLASLNTVIGFAAWALKIPLDGEWLLLGYALVAAALLITSRNSKSVRLTFTRQEIFAAIFALAMFGLIVSPLPLRPQAVHAARVIGMGGDNLSHIEFIRVIGENKGYVHNHYTELDGVLTAKLIPYPQGWHLNVSFLNKAAEAFTGPLIIDQFLYIYHILCAAGLSLLAYLFIVFSLKLMQNNRANNVVTDYLSTALFACILFSGPYFTFMTFGFQTQIAALGLLLAQLLVLTEMTNTTDRKQQKRMVFFALILAAGIAYTWFFLLPVALGTVVLYIADNLNMGLKKIRGEWGFLIACLLLGSMGLGQALFQILYAPIRSNINEPGHILETNNLLLLSMLLIAYVFIVFAYKNSRIRLVGQVTGISAIFSLLVLAHQLLSVSEPRYFYYKSTWTFVLLACVLLSVATSLVVSSVVKSIAVVKRNQYILTCALILAFFSAAYTLTPKPFRLYVSQKPYGLGEELADGLITAVRSNARHGDRTVTIGSCNREDDIKATRFAVALGGSPDFSHQDIVEAQVKSEKKEKTFKAIKEHLADEPSLILVSSDYRLQVALLEFLGEEASKVKVYELDRDKVQKTLDRCPHVLR